MNKSYATKLYLPNHIFILKFEFDCGDAKSDILPKITDGHIVTEENIDKKSTTKRFLHRDKVEHQHVRRVTTECIFCIGNLPLQEYLKAYGAELNNVSKFLSIYIPAEKKFHHDLPIAQKSDFNFNR